MAQDVYPNFSLTEFTYLVWSIMLHAVRLTFQNAILTLCSILAKKNCQIQAIRTRSKKYTHCMYGK